MTTDALPIVFCVFSFNRARFLDNCVSSIEQCASEARIMVYDDDSDDPETCEVLNRIGQRHTVVTPRGVGSSKHGGLYGNMQSALEDNRDQPLVCFLQDDTQVVRPLFAVEVERLQALLSTRGAAGFVHPCFLRGISRSRTPFRPVPAADGGAFYREDTGQSAGVHYSDLFIARPDRLLDNGWRFRASEPENDAQARALFGRMAYLQAPFAMWLPSVPAWRGKRKTWALKAAERKRTCGFYPFRIWSPEASNEFRQRGGDAPLPIAEDYLQCDPHTPPRPWSYNPLTGLHLLKQVNNIELMLRRFLD